MSVPGQISAEMHKKTWYENVETHKIRTSPRMATAHKGYYFDTLKGYITVSLVRSISRTIRHNFFGSLCQVHCTNSYNWQNWLFAHRYSNGRLVHVFLGSSLGPGPKILLSIKVSFSFKSWSSWLTLRADARLTGLSQDSFRMLHKN